MSETASSDVQFRALEHAQPDLTGTDDRHGVAWLDTTPFRSVPARRQTRCREHGLLVTDPLRDVEEVLVRVPNPGILGSSAVPRLAQFPPAVGTVRPLAPFAVKMCHRRRNHAVPGLGLRDVGANLADELRARHPSLLDGRLIEEVFICAGTECALHFENGVGRFPNARFRDVAYLIIAAPIEHQ